MSTTEGPSGVTPEMLRAAVRAGICSADDAEVRVEEYETRPPAGAVLAAAADLSGARLAL